MDTLLLRLDSRAHEASSNDAWYAEVETFAVRGGPLDQCTQARSKLLGRVEHVSTVKKFANALVWKYVKEVVAEILTRMERLESLIRTALEMDHL
ncbi:hypothetical protein LTS18_008622 [Coniosporium uncinatum]|uniref:Uncharacterized protein n=1 Tax=Coniosporium uncinatum TaxID=93489 RepID=A0ACC3D1D4_9PEZI|nr:hypothetical protein LTS18_008622 [Coniosporium uncinatum]